MSRAALAEEETRIVTKGQGVAGGASPCAAPGAHLPRPTSPRPALCLLYVLLHAAPGRRTARRLPAGGTARGNQPRSIHGRHATATRSPTAKTVPETDSAVRHARNAVSAARNGRQRNEWQQDRFPRPPTAARSLGGPALVIGVVPTCYARAIRSSPQPRSLDLADGEGRMKR